VGVQWLGRRSLYNLRWSLLVGLLIGFVGIVLKLCGDHRYPIRIEQGTTWLWMPIVPTTTIVVLLGGPRDGLG
jgi:hypothetical protein